MEQLVQEFRYKRLCGNFQDIYFALKELGPQPFVMPFWESINQKLADIFLPTPPIDFLTIREIRDTMFVQPTPAWIDAEIKFLTKSLGARLKLIAKEDATGRPATFRDNSLVSSYNTIHHLYHIYRYAEETNVKIDTIESVVEWGGGYGNLAKLWRRLNPGSTYIIIDTAFFCAIQWLYLCSVFGKNRINLLSSAADDIQAKKINIVPLALLNKVPNKSDMFISTWGLSESSKSAQDYVVKDRRWFGCRHLLVGYQDKTKELKYASRLGDLAAQDGANIIDIDFLPRNHYAFR